MLVEPDHHHSNLIDRPHLTPFQLQLGGARDGDCPVPRTFVSVRLITGSRLARLYKLAGSGIRFSTRTYLPLSFAGGVAIKQPRCSLHPFVFLQILGTVCIVRNPRYKIFTPGPRCVSTLECLFTLDLYHSGGSSGCLCKGEDTLGTVYSSSPTRSGRRIRTPA